MRPLFLCLLPLALTTSLVGQSQARNSPTSTLWEHNGSTVYLVAEGASREFHYKQPRPGMIEAGARPGSLLFRGRTANGQYVGTAYVFDHECGPRPYQVSGPVLDNYRRVVLTGQAPRVGPYPYCQIEGYSNDTLEFTLLEPGLSAPPAQPSPSGSTLVPLEKQGSTYVVPVEINGAITLPFTIDSGATDVSVPLDVFYTLRRKSTIQDADIIGEQIYVLADGSTQKTFTFTIRSLKVGDIVIYNVKGGVAPLQGSLLLGLSFLERFETWSINNKRHELLLGPQQALPY